MSPLVSWLLIAGVVAFAAAAALAVGAGLSARGFFDDDGLDAAPRRPVVPPPWDARSFEALEFEHDVLATIDRLPEVVA